MLALAGPIQALRSYCRCLRSPDPKESAARRMSIEPAHDLPSPGHEPVRRSGSIVLVLLVAGAIVAAAIAFMTLGRAQAQPYILGLLALLAMVGLFNLFAFAAGIIRFA